MCSVFISFLQPWLHQAGRMAWLLSGQLWAEGRWEKGRKRKQVTFLKALAFPCFGNLTSNISRCNYHRLPQVRRIFASSVPAFWVGAVWRPPTALPPFLSDCQCHLLGGERACNPLPVPGLYLTTAQCSHSTGDGRRLVPEQEEDWSPGNWGGEERRGPDVLNGSHLPCPACTHTAGTVLETG